MLNILDIIKQNIILYYADYLAIRNNSRQVTDNCKYYYIYEAPINLAYLCNSQPFYDINDQYYIQSTKEIQMIINKVGLEEAKKFVNGICNVKVMGCIDGDLMLKQVHQFSTNIDRITAFKDYQNWLDTQYYTHLQLNNDGDLIRTICTRHMAHSEYNTIYEPQVHYRATKQYKNEETAKITKQKV